MMGTRRNASQRGAVVSLVAAGLVSLALYAQSFGQFAVPAGAKTSLQQMCGTNNVKCVFVSQGTIYFVDFSQATPQVQAMTIDRPAFFPVISSDGKWITYQTGSSSEGGNPSDPGATVWMRSLAATGTPIKVADTGYVPRFVQNTSADTPQIVYGSTARCDYPCFDSGQTLKKKIINGVPQPAEVVLAKGSWYGGLSYDSRYLNTGIPGNLNVWMQDLQNLAAGPQAIHSMRVWKDSTTIDTFVAPGACNISRSASTIFTNTMMYFDFGSGAIAGANCFHPILGTWGEHEILYISRYDGADLKVFRLPSDVTVNTQTSPPGLGEVRGKSWDNPEWTNHPYYGAASLVLDRLFGKTVTGSGWVHDITGERVYLLNWHDSTFTNLVFRTDTSYKTTTQLQTSSNIINPWIWVEVPAGFKEDPLWLSQTIWQRAGIDNVINPIRNESPDSRGLAALNTLSGKPVRVTIFAVSGAKIAEIDLSRATVSDVGKALALARPGMYFARVSTPQSNYVVRWTKVR